MGAEEQARERAEMLTEMVGWEVGMVVTRCSCTAARSRSSHFQGRMLDTQHQDHHRRNRRRVSIYNSRHTCRS